MPVGVDVGDGAKTIAVARVGDALFGSTITGLEMTDQTINDLGQVVFTARLANGRTEIVRGTLAGAVPVPECGTFALALSALGMIGAVVIPR